MDDSKPHNRQLNSIRNDLYESELMTVKNEFKEFSYIVSHDLNAPLRHIDFFSNRIFDRISEDNKETLSEDIKIVNSAITKAKKIISLVHEYSRLATIETEIIKKEIDLHGLIKEVFDHNLKSKNVPNDALTITGQYKCSGDHALLKTLFKRVIDNALTYVSPNSLPKINIAITEQNNMLHILVSDNGIGIDKKHFDSVFVLLRRAVSDRDYMGDGVGLTMAKKIAKIHGGDLIIQSSVVSYENNNHQSGTAFLLTLPIIS